ncbi:MAG TPA: FAD:protein FMN transferase, partial [Bacteroidales bacterium]|nr:FAD:protein FMN transferase [Bacteroidales bacterium]
MNTLLDIVLWGIHQQVAETVSREIMKRIKDLQKILDRFDPAAETFQVNQSAHFEELEISPTLLKTIKSGVKDFHRSKGYFNIFSGEAYYNLKTRNDLSSLKLCANAPEKMIVLDESKNSIRFLHPNVTLDFGGIGKGLALDEASTILDEMEIKNAFISFGGSS